MGLKAHASTVGPGFSSFSAAAESRLLPNCARIISLDHKHLVPVLAFSEQVSKFSPSRDNPFATC
jgi:hypothetical protein